MDGFEFVSERAVKERKKEDLEKTASAVCRLFLFDAHNK